MGTSLSNPSSDCLRRITTTLCDPTWPCSADAVDAESGQRPARRSACSPAPFDAANGMHLGRVVQQQQQQHGGRIGRRVSLLRGCRDLIRPSSGGGLQGDGRTAAIARLQAPIECSWLGRSTPSGRTCLSCSCDCRSGEPHDCARTPRECPTSVDHTIPPFSFQCGSTVRRRSRGQSRGQVKPLCRHHRQHRRHRQCPCKECDARRAFLRRHSRETAEAQHLRREARR